MFAVPHAIWHSLVIDPSTTFPLSNAWHATIGWTSFNYIRHLKRNQGGLSMQGVNICWIIALENDDMFKQVFQLLSFLWLNTLWPDPPSSTEPSVKFFINEDPVQEDLSQTRVVWYLYQHLSALLKDYLSGCVAEGQSDSFGQVRA